MSIFSDYEVGALSDDEFDFECLRMNAEDRAERDRIYYDEDRWSDKELFHGKCPYTGEPCEFFNCHECEVEMREREYAKELDTDEEDEAEVDLDWDREAEEDFKRACERDD